MPKESVERVLQDVRIAHTVGAVAKDTLVEQKAHVGQTIHAGAEVDDVFPVGDGGGEGVFEVGYCGEDIGCC